MSFQATLQPFLLCLLSLECIFPEIEKFITWKAWPKKQDLFLRNQETLTFKACLKSIFHTGMREMSTASAPGAYRAPTWSQRRGQNSAQSGYFRFGAEISYLLLACSFQPRQRSFGVGSEAPNGERRRGKETDYSCHHLMCLMIRWASAQQGN